MSLDFNKIKSAAEGYKADMTAFLREIIRLPSESSHEGEKSKRIQKKMDELGFTKTWIDPLGNVMGWMGAGPHIVCFDGHIDTVGIGNRDNWKFDPYEGFEDDIFIGGRGVSDQTGGVVSAMYACKIMKDLGILNDKYTAMVVGSVQEEDCDGMCW